MQITKSIFNEYGFEDFSDFIGTTLGNKSLASFGIQLTAASTTAYITNVRSYVYDPPLAVALIVALLVADTVLGSIVAVKQGESFNIAKFSRIVPILLAHLGILAAAHNFAKVDPITFGWLPNAIFAFFGMRTLLSVIRNLITLKYVQGELLVWLERKIKLNMSDLNDKNIEKTHNEKINEPNPAGTDGRADDYLGSVQHYPQGDENRSDTDAGRSHNGNHRGD